MNLRFKYGINKCLYLVKSKDGYVLYDNVSFDLYNLKKMIKCQYDYEIEKVKNKLRSVLINYEDIKKIINELCIMNEIKCRVNFDLCVSDAIVEKDNTDLISFVENLNEIKSYINLLPFYKYINVTNCVTRIYSSIISILKLRKMTLNIITVNVNINANKGLVYKDIKFVINSFISFIKSFCGKNIGNKNKLFHNCTSISMYSRITKKWLDMLIQNCDILLTIYEEISMNKEKLYTLTKHVYNFEYYTQLLDFVNEQIDFYDITEDEFVKKCIDEFS